MKKILLAGVCAAALTLVAPAASQAQDVSNGWYISMFGGLSLAHDLKGKYISGAPFTEKNKMKAGPSFGLALGKSITENLRGELEFAFARHKMKSSVVTNSTGATFIYAPSGSLKSYTILGNLWYDFKNTSQFTPYLGGGLGLGIVDSNMAATRIVTISRKDSDLAFAFQVGAGVNYAVSPSVSVGLGYRFKGIVGFDLKQTAVGAIGPLKGLDLYTHNFLANVTFKFGGY